jgi:hypothetical protein
MVLEEEKYKMKVEPAIDERFWTSFRVNGCSSEVEGFLVFGFKTCLIRWTLNLLGIWDNNIMIVPACVQTGDCILKRKVRMNWIVVYGFL